MKITRFKKQLFKQIIETLVLKASYWSADSLPVAPDSFFSRS